ncbi:MAG: hypothetical protein LAP61_15590 [Acidobacteriia bacterium]|nr:hypothetical protein [Terriglobia bacterium]
MSLRSKSRRAARACSSVVLLALFCASLISPLLFASDSDSRLPACCRRTGAHKCSMVTPNSTGPGWFASPCRSYPGPQTMPTRADAGPAADSDTRVGLVSSKPPLRNTGDNRYRDVFDRSHQERGPPIRLS